MDVLEGSALIQRSEVMAYAMKTMFMARHCMIRRVNVCVCGQCPSNFGYTQIFYSTSGLENQQRFFLEAHLSPPRGVTTGIVPIPPGPSQCPILKLYSKIIPRVGLYPGSATYYLQNYKINIILTYSNVLFLLPCGRDVRSRPVSCCHNRAVGTWKIGNCHGTPLVEFFFPSGQWRSSVA